MELFSSLTEQPLQLLIPVFSAVIGWITNVLAVKMMFQPIEFVGIKPFLGGQGIIPGNALRLANTGIKLVTERLLNVHELFESFQPKAFVVGQEARLREVTEKVVEQKAAELFPAMWGALSPQIKEQVMSMAHTEVSSMSERVLIEARERIGELLDVQRIVTRAVQEDKELMGRIFQRVGSAEFQFIERSGLYFGFLFGLIQLMVWLVYTKGWVLPFFGFVVGYATNWLALKLIFEPKNVISVGPFTFQGLFHRRQKEISREFADVMSARILTSESLFRELSTGQSREILIEIVQRRGEEVISKYQSHPMMASMLKGDALESVKTEIMSQVETEMFAEGGFLYAFADKSEEIRQTLAERMSVMEATAFEDVLRPAFRQDELKLILAGAVLGLAAGMLQLAYLFGDLVSL